MAPAMLLYGSANAAHQVILLSAFVALKCQIHLFTAGLHFDLQLRAFSIQ